MPFNRGWHNTKTPETEKQGPLPNENMVFFRTTSSQHATYVDGIVIQFDPNTKPLNIDIARTKTTWHQDSFHTQWHSQNTPEHRGSPPTGGGFRPGHFLKPPEIQSLCPSKKTPTGAFFPLNSQLADGDGRFFLPGIKKKTGAGQEAHYLTGGCALTIKKSLGSGTACASSTASVRWVGSHVARPFRAYFAAGVMCEAKLGDTSRFDDEMICSET